MLTPSPIITLEKDLAMIHDLCSLYHKSDRHALQDELILQVADLTESLQDTLQDLKEQLNTATAALSTVVEHEHQPS